MWVALNYCIENLSFWKFSGNRLAAMNSPPGGTYLFAIFWFLIRNLLAVNSQLLGDACWKTQFSGFWLSCSTVMNTHQATRITLVQFLMILRFWGDFDRRGNQG